MLFHCSATLPCAAQHTEVFIGSFAFLPCLARTWPSSCFAEQRSRTVVSLRLPDARIPRIGAGVQRPLHEADPGEPGRADLVEGAGARCLVCWSPRAVCFSLNTTSVTFAT